jgi:hypothetical protein
MPAPRYATELRENTVWLSLASLWAVGGFVAWLSSVGRAEAWNDSSSGLTLLALLASATTLALRQPILSSPPGARLASTHAVWLLTMLATVNWLGFFALQAHSWSEALPAVLLLGLAEAWFHTQVWQGTALPWLRENCAAFTRRLSGFRVFAGDAVPPQPLSEPLPIAPFTSAEGTLAADPVVPPSHALHVLEIEEEEACEADASEQGTIERRTVQGVDEQGRRYLSGEIQVSLAAQQTSATLSIAFSPPFVGEPDVDFECEGAGEGVAVQLIHSTPAGMRLSLRQAANPEPINFPLQWYAAEVELSAPPQSSLTLP